MHKILRPVRKTQIIRRCPLSLLLLSAILMNSCHLIQTSQKGITLLSVAGFTPSTTTPPNPKRHHHGFIIPNSARYTFYIKDDNIGDGGTHRPIPAMPSELFQDLAMSQLELLANSLQRRHTEKNQSGDDGDDDGDEHDNNNSKIKSMALYLPQENVQTGQLEFLPAVIYPHPSTERVFIASDASSKVAPTLPKMLTTLPGFAAPDSLLPRYPMVSTPDANNADVGIVEEVLCDLESGAPALSAPLFLGSQTVGVLLVSPAIPNKNSRKQNNNIWTYKDREQIARAARTLSMALNMDTERSNLERQNNRIKEHLSDSLHQVKNPLQALRTFGKLLQQRVARAEEDNSFWDSDSMPVGTALQLLDLAQNLMVQSDRVVNLLAPMDSLVDSIENNDNLRYLNPAKPTAASMLPSSSSSVSSRSTRVSESLVPWDQAHPPSLPWESDTIAFARRETNNATATKERAVKSSSSLSTATTKSRNQTLQPVDSSGTIEFTRKPRRRQPTQKASTRTAASDSTVTYSRSKAAEATEQQPLPSSYPQHKRKSLEESSHRSQSTTSSIIGDDDEEEMAFVLDVLDPVFSLYKAISEEKGITFEILGLELADELPGILMRRKALQEAVSNLLDNAFKYSSLARIASESSNPSPRVRVRLMPNDPREMPAGCSLIVEDNGPGVPPQECAAIFERGFRSPTTSSKAEGTGIGLAISRSLLESMGGTLECLVRSNQAGQATKGSLRPELLNGAVFRVCLFRKKTSWR